MRTTCTKCGNPLDGKHPAYCKACMAERAREYRKTHPQSKADAAQWFRDNPEKRLRYKRLSQLTSYGLTRAEAKVMLDTLEAGGIECEICLEPITLGRGKGKIAPDHDHVSGAFRGLLCQRCNSMLGFAQDSQWVLSQAIAYLRRKGTPKRSARLAQ
jgi:hypothetical protein